MSQAAQATTPSQYPNLHIFDHPLIQHKLTMMRQEETPSSMFRALLKEIVMLMGFEATRNFPTKLVDINTPVAPMKAPMLDSPDVAIVPILRAGLGMSDGLLELLPTAKEGHIGLYRDPETKRPVEYMVKLPEVENRTFIVVDPMVATGHSAVHGLKVLLDRGVPREKLIFMALVASPEGIEVFNQEFGDVPLYLASLDDCLDDHMYIVPGLGDAGDRIFGTM
ncbi:MAG: uracil phosphoribosyltransferase [Alphaproteobacteria bacterium]